MDEESPPPLAVHGARDTAACLETCGDVPAINGEERAGRGRGKQQRCFQKSKSLESALFTLEEMLSSPHTTLPTSGLSLSLNTKPRLSQTQEPLSVHRLNTPQRSRRALALSLRCAALSSPMRPGFLLPSGRWAQPQPRHCSPSFPKTCLAKRGVGHQPCAQPGSPFPAPAQLQLWTSSSPCLNFSFLTTKMHQEMTSPGPEPPRPAPFPSQSPCSSQPQPHYCSEGQPQAGELVT